MGLPYEHVNFDFGAADRFSAALRSAHEKITSLAALRASQRSSQLGDPNSDNWQGGRRDAFEGPFRQEQAALHSLAEEMLRFRAAVEHAIADAHAANANAH